MASAAGAGVDDSAGLDSDFSCLGAAGSALPPASSRLNFSKAETSVPSSTRTAMG